MSRGPVPVDLTGVPLHVAADDASASLTWPADLLPLRGHYPGLPIVPGVFLVDTAARAAVALVGHGVARPTGVQRVRFLRPVLPGDTTTAHVERATPAPGGGTAVRCRLTVADVPVATVTVVLDGPAALGDPDGAPRVPAQEAVLARDVASVLPHRWPMLLVDRAVAVRSGAWAVTEKAVSAQDWVFDGVGTAGAYPWPLVLESWCQGAGVLAAWERPNPDVLAGDVMLFAGLSDVTFGHGVRPGDVLRHHVRLVRMLDGAVVVTGSSHVGGRTVLTVGSVSMALRPAHALRVPEVAAVTP
ncbi:3-hydroxyacyl-ACP dehydratase FabZ family protein [Cellulomonas shaoxiangyii]|uniref:ApeI dehydratase-like domain-containing protein n=1 Tax=Cellulomonas shaoxiangyii TaxID=2566013 RepID=A0A4P7SFH5_9CELL|nr:MaoC/PaaZ C-terminal domain-containing protein [Cellulomonas shaoxiangyii]QCB92291.1 hypothetical protein E5225_00685 [Cellulomonas shaoxiangyii]TGY85897.1 hypothetical protein E5226_04250 [Cellulomonas shaoxiangyii]